jgi:hypothetical protein
LAPIADMASLPWDPGLELAATVVKEGDSPRRRPRKRSRAVKVF